MKYIVLLDITKFMTTDTQVENSILDKVIQAKESEEASRFHPLEVLSELFESVSTREKDILERRYGLTGNSRQTLEEIGQQNKVTRERVRQIENASIKKLRGAQAFDSATAPIRSTVHQLLELHGGLMSLAHLLDELLVIPGNNDQNRASAEFIMSKLIGDRFGQVKSSSKIEQAWRLIDFNEDNFYSAVDNLVNIIKTNKQPMSFEGLISSVDNSDPSIANAVLAQLKASQFFGQDPYENWGLTKWPSITPKRMNDKIEVILRYHQKPLHFRDIATAINDAGFDHRKAYPATVHNELILHDQYVLVGRGIYALRDWGYSDGVVADVISNILSEDGPMSKSDIVKRVLEKRLVKECTVSLALMSRKRFTRDEKGRYSNV